MGFHQTKDAGGAVVVRVDGQLIVGNRQELKDLINGALVSLSKRVRELGGELRLSGLNEDLRSLFELTKLDTLFAIADTPEQALANF